MSEKNGVKKANKDTQKIKHIRPLQWYCVKASCSNRTDTKMLEIEDIYIN